MKDTKKMQIAFLYSPVAYGHHRKPWDFSALEDHPEGLTGTDLVCLSYARELAARGHEVVLYCHGVAEVTSFDGVKVRPWKFWSEEGYADAKYPWSAVVAISNPNALKDVNPSSLRVVNRQVAEFGIDTLEYQTAGFDAFVDLYTCPSETAVRRVSAPLPEAAKAKFRVLPNGCYPLSDEPYGPETADAVSGQVAYVSSPDRGLHLLLEVWPEIREKVPDAELVIAYQGLDAWLEYHCRPSKPHSGPLDFECTRRALYVRHALARLAKHGVRKVGPLSHRKVTELLVGSAVLAYPCDPMAFTETFSVAILEAAAAGAIPVISEADCLPEVHGHSAMMMPVGPGHTKRFADAVVRALTRPAVREALAPYMAEHAANHDWRKLAERFEMMLHEEIAKKRRPTVGRNPGSVQVQRVDVAAFAERERQWRMRSAYMPSSFPKAEKPRVDLVLTEYGSGPVQIDPADPYAGRSGGGCRAGFAGLVAALQRLGGYRVRAFANWRSEVGGGAPWSDGVDRRPLSHFRKDDARDVLVAYYDTSPLVGVTGCLRVASHHTFNLPCPGAVEWTDVNVAPSKYAVDALRRVYDDTAPWFVMPNAIQPDLPEWRPIAGRCVYHAAPSRGLANLLEMWPEIRRERGPGLTLHVIGDVAGWLDIYKGKQDRQAKIADRVRAMCTSLSKNPPHGVSFRGPLERGDLLRELSEASCFPFPYEAVAPCETFSVSVMECLAIGVPVVLRAGDALGSIYEGSGAWVTSTHRGVFDGTLELLGSGGRTHSEMGKRFAKQFTFDRKAIALAEAIDHGLHTGQAVPQYGEPGRNPGSVQPVNGYRMAGYP